MIGGQSAQWREEECWACSGYGVVSGPWKVTGRPQYRCPWCRGTGVLYDGTHEHGESCDCHLGRNYQPGDDWFELTGYELGDVVVASLHGLPDDVRARIEDVLEHQQEGKP